MNDYSRSLLAEAAGTFFFFTIGAGAIITNEAGGGGGLLAIALAHGIALAVAVSAFGAVSGGHFNPAVTFALAFAGKHAWGRVLPYWVAQGVGALAAGFLLLYVYSSVARAAADKTHLGTPGLGAGVSPTVAIIVEAVLTLFLVWAVLGTAVSPKAPKIAGFGIGLTVMIDILVGGPLTGAAMNPARWLGPAVAAQHFADWYVYWIGPLLGGVVGGLSYKYLFPKES
ncbi:MAG: aquaporin [Chloroflexi bacterium]|nr:aquaporin [Chloroflexota bacterium]